MPQIWWNGMSGDIQKRSPGMHRAKLKNEMKLLLLLLLTILWRFSSAKRYDLPAGWTSNNVKGNLTEIRISSGGGRYRVLSSAPGTDILSDNGTFALAYFDPSGTGSSFHLAVMMQKMNLSPPPSIAAAAAVPVWVANRSAFLSEGASFILTPRNRKFILLDPTGGTVGALWQSKAIGIQGMEIQESGMLAFYGNDSKVLWRSFDEPGDILLPGQRMSTGMRLVSSSSSSREDRTGERSSSFVPGIYSAEVVAGGLVMYVNNAPYYARSLMAGGGGRSDEQAAKKGCEGHVTVLDFIGSKLELSFVESSTSSTSSSCGSSPSLSMTLGRGADDDEQSLKRSLPYLRLNPDGDLVSYRLDPPSSSWVVDANLSSSFNDSCKLPMACGPYGICERGGCRCLLRSGRRGVESYASSSSSSCSAAPPQGIPRADQCENENFNHHFLNVSGVSYFSNAFSAPDRVSSSLEDCQAACLWNCSCAALFFNNRSRHCFFIANAVVGSLTIDPSTSSDMSAFLKFQNAEMRFGPLLPPPGADPSSSNRGTVVQIVVGVVAAAVTTAVVALVLVLRRNKRRRKKNSMDREIDDVLSSMPGLPQRFSYSSLEAATRGFSRKLGAGGFGSVYEGLLEDGQQQQRVAVKKLEGGGQQGAKQFVAEVATIGSISHLNVVRLRGFCAEASHRLLVYEFVSNGSLDRWLFSGGGSGALSWAQRVEIALGTARGLAYLHEECREPIIHLDVKPQNILLDDRFVAKVADFGMAKLLASRDVSQVVTCVRGTPGYLAPEWLLHSIATKKCDVYSYGMVLLELIGGRRNLEVTRINTDLSWYFPAWAVNEVREGRILELVDANIRSSAPRKQAVRLIWIALWCIQENATLRPAMHEVVQMLEEHRQVEEPPMSFHFAVQAQAIVDITASNDNLSMSMAYVTPPSFDVSSLIR